MSRNKIKRYFYDKGYLNTEVEVIEKVDTTYNNAVILGFKIETGSRVKISEILFTGNTAVNEKVLLKAMKTPK